MAKLITTEWEWLLFIGGIFIGMLLAGSVAFLAIVTAAAVLTEQTSGVLLLLTAWLRLLAQFLLLGLAFTGIRELVRRRRRVEGTFTALFMEAARGDYLSYTDGTGPEIKTRVTEVVGNTAAVRGVHTSGLVEWLHSWFEDRVLWPLQDRFEKARDNPA